MFEFEELNALHLEITTRCQASCPMCSRNYRGGMDNPNLKLEDWTFDDFKNIIDDKVLAQVNHIYFCGNFGDPIINHDLIPMIEYVRDNSDCQIRIHTNGGARTKQWWRDLAKAMPDNHCVIFGIDGLEDTHHIYRVGTRYERVIANAQAYIEAGGEAEWVFIKFKHNEHQVELARQRARELGFARFTVKNSTRFMEPSFRVLDNDGAVVGQLEPPSDNQVVLVDARMLKKFDSWMDGAEIKCYVQGNKELYIDAHKHLFPCCFLASTPYNYIEPGAIISPIKAKIREQYDDLISTLGGIDNLDLTKRSMRDIVSDDRWQSAWDTYWNDKKLITCARTCGVNREMDISKPADQFVERIDLG